MPSSPIFPNWFETVAFSDLTSEIKRLKAAVAKGEWAPICGSYLPTGASLVNNENGHVIFNHEGSDEEMALIYTVHNALDRLLGKISAAEKLIDKMRSHPGFSYDAELLTALDAYDKV